MTLPVLTAHHHPRYFWWPVLTLLSAAASAGSDGMLDLPEFYRTPLSEVIYEEQTTWRATPEADNGWRTQDDGRIQQGRLRKEVLPEFDYQERGDPTLGSTFMNERELARPKTNVFRLKF
jgi:hypothetical protein